MVLIYQRLVAAFAVILGILTWNLWIGGGEYPQIPLFQRFVFVPHYVDWLLLGLVALSLAAMLRLRRQSRSNCFACLSFSLTVIMLIALDQHRCQPWVYQFALACAILGLVDDCRALQLLRVLVASIYVYSALGKFDYQFLHTVGQQFLTVLASSLGTSIQQFSLDVRLVLASAFPTIELLIGIGLFMPATRRWSSIAAVFMHVVIIHILGPWGLNHYWGVMVWNLFFAAQAVVLFGVLGPEGRELQARSEYSASNKNSRRVCGAGTAEAIGCGILGLAVVLPLGERSGWCDHWLGWALYAPHSSRVRVEVAPVALDRLPASLKQIIAPTGEDQLWIEVPIAQWSLHSRAAPIYPQARYELGIAQNLVAPLSDFEFRVTLQSTADRWTGKRREHDCSRHAELGQQANMFLFNSQPRHTRTANLGFIGVGSLFRVNSLPIHFSSSAKKTPDPDKPIQLSPLKTAVSESR